MYLELKKSKLSDFTEEVFNPGFEGRAASDGMDARKFTTTRLHENSIPKSAMIPRFSRSVYRLKKAIVMF